MANRRFSDQKNPQTEGPPALQKAIHVYHADFEVLKSRLDLYKSFLSQEERDKFGRYSVVEFREQSILSRGFLREQLSRYTGMAPADHVIRESKYKKPEVKELSYPLEFSVSHSFGKIVLAFALGRKIGIDLEKKDAERDWKSIFPLVFSAQEQHQILTLKEHDQAESFYRAWTQKEAFLKAIGSGFNLNPKDFIFDIHPESSPILLMSRRKDDPFEFSLHLLPELGNFMGMLAFEHKGEDPEVIVVQA